MWIIFSWRARSQDWDHTRRIAADAATRLGDLRAQAITLLNWSGCEIVRGRTSLAEQCQRRALDLFGQIGDRQAQAGVLLNLGWIASDADHDEEAIQLMQQVCQLASELGDYEIEVAALVVIGLCHVRRGHQTEAALDLSRKLGDQVNQAEILGDLADACSADGRHDEAVRTCEQALSILTDVGHPAAFKFRAKLEELKANAAPSPT